MKDKSKVSSERSESRDRTNKIFTVYILRTSSNTFYIGQTSNLEKRSKEHKNKTSKSAKYIRYFPSIRLVYSESYPTRKEAMKREIQLKKWSRAKKRSFDSGRYNRVKESLAWAPPKFSARKSRPWRD